MSADEADPFVSDQSPESSTAACLTLLTFLRSEWCLYARPFLSRAVYFSVLRSSSDISKLAERYEEIIAKKDDAIRRLTVLVADVEARSPRQGFHDSSQILLEKLFTKIPPERHGLISVFRAEDWEASLDGLTQLMFSILVLSSGMKITRLETLKTQDGITVDYKASCVVTGGYTGSLWTFPFDLIFTIDGFSSTSPENEDPASINRTVLYEPSLAVQLSRDATLKLGSFAKPASFPLASLPNFYHHLRQSVTSAFDVTGTGVADDIQA
ncbi:hypothetical protein VNI00_013135 [Paramarasmius palmivorus]|uniref:Uncharacterized protein n=1 Tax=Paramarasmius palmivorus TaxID=297713 RepID=A0AAW0C2L0_9AGAR